MNARQLSLGEAVSGPRRMRAISIRQPWAELIASGRKTIEVRSWVTHHRGPLLVCAGGGWHADGVKLHGKLGPLGVTLCTVDLVAVRPYMLEDADASLSVDPAKNVSEGMFAWVLANVQRVEPRPLKGKLGFFDVTL